jgi:hypothetical protein
VITSLDCTEGLDELDARMFGGGWLQNFVVEDS